VQLQSLETIGGSPRDDSVCSRIPPSSATSSGCELLHEAGAVPAIPRGCGEAVFRVLDDRDSVGADGAVGGGDAEGVAVVGGGGGPADDDTVGDAEDIFDGKAEVGEGAADLAGEVDEGVGADDGLLLVAMGAAAGRHDLVDDGEVGAVPELVKPLAGAKDV